MDRRGFLAAVAGCVVAPFVPAPRWTWDPRRIAFRSSVYAPVVVQKRVIYATVRISPEMMPANGGGAFRRACEQEYAGIIEDMSRCFDGAGTVRKTNRNRVA